MPRATYLNHAGTSWPKPAPVREAVIAALDHGPEGGQTLGWAERFDRDHRAVAAAFGVADPARLLLTPGCTSALAVAIADLPWEPGERVLTSAWEHDALLRPVLALAARGVEHRVIPPVDGDPDAPLDLDRLESELGAGRVRLVALTGAANVTGALLPVAEVSALAHAHGAAVLLDAAQLAGWIELDVGGPALGVDMLAFAGHKGPQAPWGVGGLWVSPRLELAPPRSAAHALVARRLGRVRPTMAGYCDTGSVDRLALAGLVAGLEWLAAAARADRLARARAVVDRLAEGLRERGDATLHGPARSELRVPTLAFSLRGRSPEAVAEHLHARGVVASGGRQCAPMAHATLGTPGGVVRVSAGPSTTIEAAARTLAALEGLPVLP
ncbi:cysteine desulfurase [Plesiocystis pacifica SIR-1]|uniref:Cysteine desulfurase n=1 Tax=Plesiocystis pacifica SIR-1 TaxID=391625 RepID=A6GKF0_9BACT|nr:aminotransferase class V-fold PLP-dependent enzyme [Plesiocystis pacifica]EDM73652.1 cysteine desulfurase [Plesiocystis pacifica SIR-1]